MDLTEKFNEDLRGGKQIQGMMRSNGYYVGEQDDGSQHVLFDSGNLYILKDKEIVSRIESTDEYFIDKQILSAIYKFIDSTPLMNEKYEYSDSNYEDVIDFYTINKLETAKKRGGLIRLVINRSTRHISISNILIPFEIKYNGFGKELIKQIFQIAETHGYDLYLVQMVDSFYERMVARGAKIIEAYETLQITKETNLGRDRI